MSSDSEEDCYGNIAQKLQSIRNQYCADNLQIKDLMDSSLDTPKGVEKARKITESSAEVACVELKDDSDCEEISLDAIIAQNAKKKAVRKSKRNADISVDNIIKSPVNKRSRTTRNSKKSAVSNKSDVTLENASDISDVSNAMDIAVESSFNTSTRGKTRGRTRGRGRRGAQNSNNTTTNQASVNMSANNIVSTSNTLNTSNSTVTAVSSPLQRSRGRRGRRSNVHTNRAVHQFLSRMFGQNNPYCPTYSVGNTDEYPDECYNQPLFNTNQSTKEDVILVENEQNNDLDESLEENEELSVKVYWQNRECVKFTIRRFQKLQTIFDFFTNREKVSPDKLFFTYNEKILKKDDTPDSITYSEVKFIDGGIIHQSLSNIVQNNDQETVKNGIKLKFQCQNAKKPFEVYVKPEEKLAIAMLQCAEHLEKPLDKLKFLFDGDLITGKSTPKDLDLEGGECIDVKIIT